MISVVVPAYNESRYIPDCLESLVRQKTRQEFEVIVVDNGSTDDTAAAAGRFKKQLNLRIIHEPTKGRGDARRAGFAAARGDIILSTDSDTIVPADWIDRLSRDLVNGTFRATTGGCYIYGFHPAVNWLIHIGQLVHLFAYRVLFRHFWLAGFNFGITRELYEKSGGFTAHLNAIEDLDLSFRVYPLATIRFLPDCSVTMSGRRFNRSILRGLGGYYTSFFYYYFAKKRPVMSDVR